jgi:hypothetical protein
MNRGTLISLAAVPVIGLMVFMGGVAMAPDGRSGVMVGVLLGCVIQLLLLGATQAAFPDKPLAAYGVGLVARMVVVVAAALVLVPATRLPPAPMLLSLVTVLFATTLLEPVALAAGRRTKS